MEMGLHEGSTLGPFLCALVMNVFMRDILNKVLWYMLFVDDIGLIDETCSEANTKLDHKCIDMNFEG